MELMDFTEFEPFNDLRRKMGTDRLGYFELFDPAIHLTGSERSELENVGRLVKPNELRILPDKTLAIKNSRVLAYNPDESWYRNHRQYPTYHVAFCSQLEELIKQQPEQDLLATTRIDQDYELVRIRPSGEVTMVSHGFVVCKHCLHSLRQQLRPKDTVGRHSRSRSPVISMAIRPYLQQTRRTRATEKTPLHTAHDETIALNRTNTDREKHP